MPGYKLHGKEAKTATGEDALRLPLGAIRYDQPRHALIDPNPSPNPNPNPNPNPSPSPKPNP